MKYKILALSLVMLISLCGCGNTSTVDKIIEQNSQTNKQDVAGKNTDKDNGLTYIYLDRAKFE